MSRKLIIFIPRFEIGGTNTSLRNWIAKIDRSKYDISVFAMAHTGPLKGIFKDEANILSEDKLLSAMITNYGHSKGFGNKILSTIVKCAVRTGRIVKIDISGWIYKMAARRITRLGFDTAIAFQEGVATTLASYVKANNLIAIIRCNYKNYLDVSVLSPESQIYSKFDRVITVSGYTADVFNELLPECQSKTLAIHNIINDKKIIEFAAESLDDSEFDTSCFTIISVGRIDPVKRFDMIPSIVKQTIARTDCCFKWYIIGGGSPVALDHIRELVAECGVEGRVKCLGQRLNPYKYIKMADLVVLTSLSEACPNVLNEAKIIGTPPLATDFGSVWEFIENKETGFIAPIEQIPAVLASILNDREEYENVKQRLRSFRYDNEEIIERIYEVLK